MVPGEGSGPNVCPFDSSGWRRLDGGCDVGSKQLAKLPQVSDVGSIPIARSITLDDSIVLTPPSLLNKATN
jgi:hypothetical protein